MGINTIDFLVVFCFPILKAKKRSKNQYPFCDIHVDDLHSTIPYTSLRTLYRLHMSVISFAPPIGKAKRSIKNI